VPQPTTLPRDPNNIGSADKMNKITSMKQYLPLSEAEIKGPLHPAQTTLGYFLAWFQSLQIPSTQSKSPLALVPLVPKSHVSFNSSIQL
jgi:hypothetical protein